jgi:hypothetical protein
MMFATAGFALPWMIVWTKLSIEWTIYDTSSFDKEFDLRQISQGA